jgi:predicted phage terminase large subunit-like protein
LTALQNVPPGVAQWPPHLVATYAWQADWRTRRLPHQVPPPGDWTVWGLIAGRGAGKTRAAAETLAAWAWEQPGSRNLVSGRTTADMRTVCFEGESGLLNVIPRELIATWNKSLFEITLINGSLIKGIAAEQPEAFRGPQWGAAWLDELAAWQYMQEAWDMIMFSMRLGQHPRVIVSTTPKPKPLIKKLVEGKLGFPSVVTRGSTYDNLDNLAPTFRQQILQYEGTQLGRQEIHAEILDLEENGIIRRSWWKPYFGRTKDDRPMPLPPFEHIVMSLDTAFTEATRNKDTGDPDYTACTVWGLFWRKVKSKANPDADTIKPGFMLLDAWQDRIGMPELVERVKKERLSRYGGEEQRVLIKPRIGPAVMSDVGHPVDTILIEDKGSGISLRQILHREEIPAVPYNPGKAKKLDRLHGVSNFFANGWVYALQVEDKVRVNEQGRPMKRFADWAEDVIGQVCTFHGEGTIDHDDYVDATVQAIRYLADTCGHAVTVEPEPEEIDPASLKRKENPYG